MGRNLGLCGLGETSIGYGKRACDRFLKPVASCYRLSLQSLKAPELKDRLQESEKLIQEMTISWEEKLRKTEEIAQVNAIWLDGFFAIEAGRPTAHHLTICTHFTSC